MGSVPHCLVMGGKGTAADKMAAMEKAGVNVVTNPSLIGETMKKVLSK